MSTAADQRPKADICAMLPGASIALVGRLATVTRAQLEDIVRTFGGVSVSRRNDLPPGIRIVVIGQRDWLLSRNGMLPDTLRLVPIIQRETGRTPVVISEEEFLAGIGRNDLAELAGPRLYTTATLVELLGVTRQRLNAWVRAGLIAPEKVEDGVWYFEFRSVTAAKTVSDLWRSGVSLRRLRKSIDQLRTWLPGAEQPLQQIAAIERNGHMLIRLEDGDLAATDGQLILDFTTEGRDRDRVQPEDECQDTGPSLRLFHEPRTQNEWHERGIEQEQAGHLQEAIESYREALRVGGPDAVVCFDLAHCLYASGQRLPALERYLQATEIDRDFKDAWNNVGVLLCEMGRHEAACTAFRRALAVDPNDARAHYNLADALDELRIHSEACEHWRAYLRFDATSSHAEHAKFRVSVCG